MTRLVVAFLLLSLLAAPLAVHAQTGRTYRVSYISGPTAESQSYLQTFRAALADLGYVEGKNLILDGRVADRDLSGAPALVDELIALRPGCWEYHRIGEDKYEGWGSGKHIISFWRVK